MMPMVFPGLLGSLLVISVGCAQPSAAQQPPASPQPPVSPQTSVSPQSAPASQGQPGLATQFSEVVTRVYQQAAPAVVTVVSSVIQSDTSPIQQQQGTGSGFIIDQRGHIVTNDHVIQDANRLEVTRTNGRTVPATLVGRDPFFDLAVIRIDPAGQLLPTVPLGNSDNVRIGEIAIAIGNPFGLESSVTTGVISARRGTISEPQRGGILIDAIQTDAAINPGNSGGPLLNAQGEVVGVNTLARLGVGGGTAGINFAIPSNAVQRIVPTLIQTGTYQHPFLGIGTVPISASIASELNLPVTEGLVVQTVEQGSGAAQAGIRPAGAPRQIRSREVGVGGDIIIAVDGQPIVQSSDLLA